MLSYAFLNLCKKDYKKLGDEKFDNIADLFSEILYKGISELLKRGVNREYIEKQENISTIRGKIDLLETFKVTNILKRKISCIYEDFSINSYLNKILKTTLLLLLKSDIKNERRIKIQRILIYFNDVDIININNINWHFRYNKNNQTYQMLVGICYLTLHGLLQKDSDGNTKLIQFTHEQMSKLYEKFILEYYKKEFRDNKKLLVNSSQIKWGIEDANDYDDMLPKMQSDIMLNYNDKTLIIDAKYYEETLQEFKKQEFQNSKKLKSGHLYQILSYVKNHEFNHKEEKVMGLLLYAKTNEEIYPNNTYTICGNKISARTLDLNQDFNEIKSSLNNIVYEFLELT